MAYQKSLVALSDPTRRQLFERLARGPAPVGKLAEGLPVSRPAVSQHLKVLSDAGLVSLRRDGTRNIYAVRREGLAGLRAYLDGLWSDVLDAFAAEVEAQVADASDPDPGQLTETAGTGRRSGPRLSDFGGWYRPAGDR